MDLIQLPIILYWTYLVCRSFAVCPPGPFCKRPGHLLRLARHTPRYTLDYSLAVRRIHTYFLCYIFNHFHYIYMYMSNNVRSKTSAILCVTSNLFMKFDGRGTLDTKPPSWPELTNIWSILQEKTRANSSQYEFSKLLSLVLAFGTHQTDIIGHFTVFGLMLYFLCRILALLLHLLVLCLIGTVVVFKNLSLSQDVDTSDFFVLSQTKNDRVTNDRARLLFQSATIKLASKLRRLK